MDTSRARAALLYTIIWCCAFIFGLVGVPIFPIPIAVYVVRRRWNSALGLLLCAGCAALATAGTIRALAYYLVIAGMGFLLGVGMARRWTYGRIVTAVAGSAFIIFFLGALTNWDAWNAHAAAYLDGLLVQARQVAEQTDGAADSPQFQMLVWLRAQWAYVGYGWILGQMVIGACVVLTATAWFLRKRFDEPGPRGCFSEMRPPDVLVWLVIGAAVLWFLDRRWPHDAVRAVSWNTAIALYVVYSLNGLALVVYIFDVLKPPIMIYIVTVVFLVSFGATPALGMIGLFDTWGEFRDKADRFVAARKIGPDSSDDGS